MSDLHNDYLKDEHLEDEDEEQLNLNSQKVYQRDAQTPDEELQTVIMELVANLQQKQDRISADLESKLQGLLARIGGQNEEDLVRLRMNQLALNKILVYTHGKSEFRLVAAHHHMGKAYLNYKCYEQAIDHITLSLKKNSKLIDVKQTKLYHSMLLTTLAKCYYEISSYDDSIEVLNRALQIQTSCYKQLGQSDKCHIETYRLSACCYLKMKNYKKAHEYVKTALDSCATVHGQKSKEVCKLKVDVARIYFQEKNYDQAIEELDTAIENLIQIGYKNKLELIDLEDLLAFYLDKNGQPDKQIQTYYAKLQLMEQTYDKEHKIVLKFKRTIASALIKQQRNQEAKAVLEQILENEQKVYGPNSLHVGKTLKMLGIVFMATDEINPAQNYLKRAQKILQQQGNTKLVKEIKTKLLVLKESREKKINNMLNTE